MSEKSVLPPQLAEYDDERLGSAREKLQGSKASDYMREFDPIIVDLPDGRQTAYYYFETENQSNAKTVIHFQPVANGLKPQGVPLVNAIQSLTDHNVLFVPQNNYTLTKPERKLVVNGNFAPLAEQRLRILDHAAFLGQVALNSVNLAGFSFGATDAAATMSAISRHNVGVVGSAVFGEPANIIERSRLQLLHDFVAPSSKTFVDAVLMSQLPALIELWGVSDGDSSSTYMKSDFAGFARDFVKYRNIVPALGLRYAAFADNVMDGLDATAFGARIVAHKDLDSILTPEQAFDEQTQRIAASSLARHISLRIVKTSTEKAVGHAIGDNPWFWATLVRMGIEKPGSGVNYS